MSEHTTEGHVDDGSPAPRTTDEHTVVRRVGALAEATGLTVRTLHYYEEIGLLVPSQRSEAGHRLYDASDVQRLYRISLLRRLGLPLEEIARALDDPGWDLRGALAGHLTEVDRQFEATRRLRGHLTALSTSIVAGEEPGIQQLLDVLEDMTVLNTNVQQRISILVYRDIQASYDYLIRVFGLSPGEVTRDGDGNVVHAEIEAGDGTVWLHPESPEFGLASPATTGAATATMAVMVDDVDAHFRHASEQGATIDYEPVDQPYGYREYSARDPEGALWSFMKPLDATSN